DNEIELEERVKDKAMYGFHTVGEMQNTICRAIVHKNSLLRYAKTNIGKSRLSIAEATDLAISKWYNPKKKEWEPRNQKRKVLFISTEMEEDELQPTMWAYISGVAEERIKDADITEEEEEVLKEGILHLQECDLFIEYVPK